MGKNEVDFIVLGVSLGGPAHGYEVKKKRIAISFGSQYHDLGDSGVYPRLVRFEKKSFLTTKWK
jgi:DNA-binding PadR family transcriptional regulator